MQGLGRRAKMQLVADKKNANSINLIHRFCFSRFSIQEQILKSSEPVSPEKATKLQTLKPNFFKKLTESSQINRYDTSLSGQGNALFKPSTKIDHRINRIKTQGFNNVIQAKYQNLRDQLDKFTKIRDTQTTKSLHRSNHTMDICYNESHFPNRGPISNSTKIFPTQGIYNHPSLDSSLKYSFSKSKRVLANEKVVQQKKYVPAPNCYNNSNEKNHHKYGIFPLAPRKTITTNDNPGPGLYSLEKHLVEREGGYISKQKRQKSHLNDGPGPALYQTISLNSIKKKMPSIVIGRSEIKRCQSRVKVPGPNSYIINESLNSSRVKGGAFGKSRKINEKKIESPGPLNYSPKYCQILIKSPSAIIGKQLRKSYQEHNDSWDQKPTKNHSLVEEQGYKNKKIKSKMNLIQEGRTREQFRIKSKSEVKNRLNRN